MKPTELVTRLPGHPTHPPLTDVVTGLSSGATKNMAVAWWVADAGDGVTRGGA